MTTSCRYARREDRSCTTCGHCHVCGAQVAGLSTLDAITAHDFKVHQAYEDSKIARRREAMGHVLCAICGIEEATQWDHIVPVRHGGGGTDEPCNMQPACAECNRKKSDGYDIRKCRHCAQNYPGMAEWLEANAEVPDWNDVRVVTNSVTYGGPGGDSREAGRSRALDPSERDDLVVSATPSTSPSGCRSASCSSTAPSWPG